MKSVFESEKINYIHVSLDLIDDYLIMVNDREIQKCISTKIRVYSREDEVNWVKAKLEEGAQVFSMISKEDGSYIGNVELMDIENGSAIIDIGILSGQANDGLENNLNKDNYKNIEIKFTNMPNNLKNGLKNLYLNIEDD